MRQFAGSQFDIERVRNQRTGLLLSQFRKYETALANALGIQTALRPEMSLMLEVYFAHIRNEKLNVTMLGLLDGIPPTTTLRYLQILEEHGAVQRSAHERDQRMKHIEITEAAKRAIDEAISSIDANASASYKPI